MLLVACGIIAEPNVSENYHIVEEAFGKYNSAT